MDKYIYSDPSDPLLDKICKLVYKDKDTNNKEAIKSIDQDGDGILEPHELQRAFNKPYIAHRLSHLVVKHTSEWAYLGNKVSALKSDIQAIFDDVISTEEDEALKNTLKTLKEERLTAFEKRIKQLAIWDRINPPKKSYASKIVDGTLLTNPVTAIPYLEYRLGKWAYKKLTSDEETEKEINLAPYKFDKPEVYHFHPIAFVEQMRRVFSKYISKHITYEQAIASYTAKKLKIDNNATTDHIYNMQLLGQKVFDPIYEHFDGKILINIMYRSPKLNSNIKGASKNSQHMKGQAIDIDALDPYTNRDIFIYVIKNLDFDQIVWEFGTMQIPDWIHISYKHTDNRKKMTQAYTSNGKDWYKPLDLNTVNINK